ncbi:MAG TPA: hypothetical protein VF777_05645 [Phycisphaerales bacterium]
MRWMRPIGGLCGLALVASAWTVRASAQELIGSPPADAAASGFDDRSAPSLYQYDNGAVFPLRWLEAPRDALMMQRFDTVGGSDLLTSVSVRFGTMPAGRAAKIYIWSNPTGDGSPTNCVLVHQQDITIGTAGNLNAYPLAAPVPVRGVFFVGASVMQETPSEAPYAVDPVTPYVAGRSWVGYALTSVDGSNLSGLDGLSDLQSFGFSSYLHIRANGSGSSFGYQARLASAGQNYTGVADFVFTLYDSPEGGNVVGVPTTMIGVPVTAGVFSVQIPSDPLWFLGAPDRYLDVQVRTPADGDMYTSLTPRQRIGQVPAAMVATVAQTVQSVPWSALTGVPSGLGAWQSTTGGIAYSGGNVGIGTNTPAAALHVKGGPPYDNTLFESGFPDGTWLNLWNTSPNGREWSLISTGATNTEGAGALLIRDRSAGIVRATFLPNGNVGFGTIAPTRRLQVRGDGIGFSHISSDGSTEIASYADPNFGTFGTYSNKSLLLLSNGAAHMAVTPLGRVGVGTTAPSDTLDVRGNIRLGSNGEYQAAAGQAEALATIRGVLNPDGTIRHGSGFTATRLAVGTYRISWSASPGFSDHPAFVGSAFVSSPVTVWYNDLSLAADRSGFVVVRTTNTAGASVDARFSFTLTGPR